MIVKKLVKTHSPRSHMYAAAGIAAAMIAFNHTTAWASELAGPMQHPSTVTFLGGAGHDYVAAAVKSPDGNIFIAGKTAGPRAGTVGDGGGYDVFVMKLTPALDRVLARVVFGGSGDEFVGDIQADAAGRVYVTGMTYSPNFPGVDQDRFHGKGDGFVVKLDPDLYGIHRARLFGGDDYDYARAMALAGDGSVFITGNTASQQFPLTANAVDSELEPSPEWRHDYGTDAFVTRFDMDLNGPIASTYLGGRNDDYGYDVLVNDNTDVFVIGNSSSPDFPVTAGTFASPYTERTSIFISRLDPDLSKLKASAYFGGTNQDYARAAVLDGRGFLYVTGHTTAGNFPFAPNAYQRRHGGGYSDGIVFKIDTDLRRIPASTFYGGGNSDYLRSIAVADDGSIYVSGHTDSLNDVPLTVPRSRRWFDLGHFDAVVAQFNSELTELRSAVLLGASGVDFGSALVRGPGTLYLAGYTSSRQFPVSANALQQKYLGGRYDAFLARFQE